jgi:hypothetical protein
MFCRYFAIKDSWPTEFISLPAFGVWELDFGPVLAWDPDAWSAVVAYALVMIFDIGGALYGLCSLAGALCLVSNAGTSTLGCDACSMLP